MTSDNDVYYQAMLARDYRFDGKFFVGVKTTGIYCRPICPAKPKRQNIEFFSNAILAEKSGYRPCLRCRPESAPLSPVWIGQSATVQRALKLIANNTLQGKDENTFAEYLGMSARHLRRVFKEELGKTPKQISDINRLNFARQLIVETSLPITEIAFTSGFCSVRQFNDAFKTRFHRPPSFLRKNCTQSAHKDAGIQLTLPYRPPYDWKSILSFYDSHHIIGVESIKNDCYERVFEIEGVVGALNVSNDPKNCQLLLKIYTQQTKSIYQIVKNIRQMFDLDLDPILISNSFSKCKIMAPLSEKHPGLRLPRGWNSFEVAIGTILGQLVSTEQARRLLQQLVESYGKKVKSPISEQVHFLFPTAKTLANTDLSALKTTQARKNTINAFSKKIADGEITLDSTQDMANFKKSLLEIKGIGNWTAEYMSMRALGDTNAFPGSDLILKRVLEQYPSMAIESLEPWKAYAAIYLWKEFAQSLTRKKKL